MFRGTVAGAQGKTKAVAAKRCKSFDHSGHREDFHASSQRINMMSLSHFVVGTAVALRSHISTRIMKYTQTEEQKSN